MRAEVLGALVNSVYMLALCFAIFVEAVQRLSIGKTTNIDPDTMLYVGIVGLVFNLIALVLFHRYGHSHVAAGKPHSRRAVQGSSGQRDAENVDVCEYSLVDLRL